MAGGPAGKGLTKEEILTYYLNNVPMGGNFIGIETAAKGYYGKDVRELSWPNAPALQASPIGPANTCPPPKAI